MPVVRLPRPGLKTVADKSVHGKERWIMEAALVKSDVWSYEQEWRLVIPDITLLSNKPGKSINYDDFYINLKNDMKAIYLGAKAPAEKVPYILDYYKDDNLPIFQMELRKDKYELIERKLKK